jgi:hypothetical protein
MITKFLTYLKKKNLFNKSRKDTHFQEWYSCFPIELRKQIDTLDQTSVWHPEGVLVNHLYLIFKYIEKNFDSNKDLLGACFFHDLGKIDTYKFENGKPSFRGHDEDRFVNKYLDLYFDNFFKFNLDREKVKELCLNHMRCHIYNDGTMSRRSKREAFEKLTYFDDIIKFAEADEKSKYLI